MKNILNITLRLFIICLISVAALAGVNELTKARIAENAVADLNAAMQELVPAESYSNADFTDFIKDSADFLAADYSATVTDAYIAKSGDQVEGYVVVLATKGYGGTITVNVGLSAELKVTGAIISSHTETPGLGARTADKSFLDQFIGKSGSVTLDDINAISGATISSRGVTNAVDTAVKFAADFLKKA